MPVVFSPEAKQDLLEIYDYIEAASSAKRAFRFTGNIEGRCKTIAIFPDAGTPHDDIRPGLRITSFRKRVLIAYHLRSEARLLSTAFFMVDVICRKHSVDHVQYSRLTVL